MVAPVTEAPQTTTTSDSRKSLILVYNAEGTAYPDHKCLTTIKEFDEYLATHENAARYTAYVSTMTTIDAARALYAADMLKAKLYVGTWQDGHFTTYEVDGDGRIPNWPSNLGFIETLLLAALISSGNKTEDRRAESIARLEKEIATELAMEIVH